MQSFSATNIFDINAIVGLESSGLQFIKSFRFKNVIKFNFLINFGIQL